MKNETIPSYPKYNLTPKSTGIQVLGVPKLRVVGSDLVLLTRADSSLLKVYTSDFKLLGGSWSLSEFPNDLKLPLFQAHSIPQQKNTVGIYDLPSSAVLDLEYKVVEGDFEWGFTLERVSGLDYFPLSILVLRDSLKIYVPESGGSLVIEKPLENKVLLKKYPFFLFESISPTNLSSVFQSVQTINYSKETIALAPIMTGELELYDFSGNLIRSVIYDDFNHDKEKLAKADFTETDLRILAVDISASEDYIYILSANYPLNSYLTGVPSNASQIFKFNWDGDVQAVYNLNISGTSFGVDEVKRRFYVTVNENDENPIWYFDF
ncbi:TolB-like 6-bladed beta-propeller domain-containing protein [Algoriphagus namhaensis]